MLWLAMIQYVLLATTKRMLQRIVDKFKNDVSAKNLRENVTKSNDTKNGKSEKTDFAKPYRLRPQKMTNCMILLGDGKMEEVTEFK